MTKEEIIRNLKYTMEKHKNDTVPTFGTNISLMCKDILDYLEREPCEDVISRYGVPHKIAEFFSNWDGDKNATMEISVNDMREIAFVYTKKARIERQLKEKTLEQQPCEDAISREQAINQCGFGMTSLHIADNLRRLPSVQPKILACGEGELDVPDTNAGDTISRQAVIDTIFAECSGTKLDIDFAKVLILQRTIKDLPLAQSQPKTGHWIYEERKRLINETDEGAEYVTDYWCKCSKCGGDFGYRKMEDAFCKYCGARMIEPQESEDKE